MKRLGVGLIGIAIVVSLLAPSFAGERDGAVLATKTAEQRLVPSAPAPRPRGDALRSQAPSPDRDRLLLLLLILGARAPGSER